MTDTRWWWVRHAPVTCNQGRMYGASDPDADIDDPDAYAGLAGFLPAGAQWVTSHLSRARETARAIAAAGLYIGAPLVEPAFGEQNFGDWQGNRYEDIPALAAPHLHQFWFTTVDHAPPGGESFNQVMARVSGAIERLNQAHSGRDVVVVSHGGPIRAALAHGLGLDGDGAVGFVTDNLSVTRLDHVETPGAGRSWQARFVNRVPRRSNSPAPAAPDVLA